MYSKITYNMRAELRPVLEHLLTSLTLCQTHIQTQVVLSYVNFEQVLHFESDKKKLRPDLLSVAGNLDLFA